MDFFWQPVPSLEDLRDEFGSALLRRGADIADSVVFGGPATGDHKAGEYYAAVGDHRVTYDGVMLPGTCRCTCPGTFMSHYCEHLAAVALVVLGRGDMPADFAEALADIEFDHHAEIDSLPTDAMRDMLHILAARSVLARTMLRDRAALHHKLADDGRDPDDARTALEEAAGKLRRAPADPDEFAAEVGAFTDLASTFLAAGFGRSISGILLDAIGVAQTRIRELVRNLPAPSEPSAFDLPDSRRENIERLGDPIVDVLVGASPKQDRALLDRVVGILEREEPGEEMILMQPMKTLLGDELLPDLLEWLEARGDDSIPSWGRRLHLAGHLGYRGRYRELLRDAPPGAHRVAAAALLAEEATDERVAVFEHFLDEDVLTHRSYGTSKVYLVPVADWLAQADSPAAGDLLRRMAVECFDTGELWTSMHVFVLAFGRDDEARSLAHELGERVPRSTDATGLRALELHESLRTAIIDSYFVDERPDVELIDVDDAFKSDLDSVWDAMQLLREDFPATAVNMGIRVVLGRADGESYRPMIRTAVRDVAELCMECGQGHRLLELLMELRRRTEISDGVWRNLVEVGLRPFPTYLT